MRIRGSQLGGAAAKPSGGPALGPVSFNHECSMHGGTMVIESRKTAKAAGSDGSETQRGAPHEAQSPSTPNIPCSTGIIN